MRRVYVWQGAQFLATAVLALAAAVGAVGCTGFDTEGPAPGDDVIDSRGTAKDWAEVEVEEEPVEYRYIRVNDLSVDTFMGADIDAVMVDKAFDGFCYPDTLVELRRGDSVVAAPVEEYILGPPDAYRYDGRRGPFCDEPGKYVELGGKGGYLVVGMECEIEDFDDIIVLEQYDCAPLDEAEEIEAFVGTTPEGPWVPLERRGEHPELRFRTWELPR